MSSSVASLLCGSIPVDEFFYEICSRHQLERHRRGLHAQTVEAVLPLLRLPLAGGWLPIFRLNALSPGARPPTAACLSGPIVARLCDAWNQTLRGKFFSKEWM
jgi:hypothetical protein